MPLTDVFARLGLRRPWTTAIDVDRLTSRLADGPTLRTVAGAVSGVVAAAIALADPGKVVMGGSWGRDPRVIRALTERLAAAPRAVPLRTAIAAEHPDHLGARTYGLAELRTLIAARA